jgi:hypothetical protein
MEEAMIENNGEKGFVIKDRRLFDEEGKVREEGAQEEAKKEETPSESKPEQKSGGGAPKTAREEKPEPGGKEEYEGPEMNFHNFVLSLYTSVLFHLGEMPDPGSGKNEKDLRAAKQTIDILAMLQEKTKKNLEKGERDLIEGVLSEARMRYVKESGKP